MLIRAWEACLLDVKEDIPDSAWALWNESCGTVVSPPCGKPHCHREPLSLLRTSVKQGDFSQQVEQ